MPYVCCASVTYGPVPIHQCGGNGTKPALQDCAYRTESHMRYSEYTNAASGNAPSDVHLFPNEVTYTYLGPAQLLHQKTTSPHPTRIGLHRVARALGTTRLPAQL